MDAKVTEECMRRESITVDGFMFRRRPRRSVAPLDSLPRPAPEAIGVSPDAAVAPATVLSVVGAEPAMRHSKIISKPVPFSAMPAVECVAHARPRAVLSPGHQDNVRSVSTTRRRPKRQRKSRPRAKPYTSIPANLPEEDRFAKLVESILRQEYATLASQLSSSGLDLQKVEEAIVSVIEAACDCRGDAPPISKIRRPNPRNVQLQRQEAVLKYVVDEYQSELEQWKRVAEDLNKIAQDSNAKQELHVLPPIPSAANLADVAAPERLHAAAVGAAEQFILHAEEANYSIKRMERDHLKTVAVISAVADTLNANVFDGVLNMPWKEVS